MRQFLLSFLCYALAVTMAHGAEKSTGEAGLASLISQISTVQGGSGIGKRDQELAKQIQAFDAEAIPHLLPLLDNPEERFRTFAGYVLRDQKGLTVAHLPALIAAFKKGNGWISPAIARIGTPSAIEALVVGLQSKPESNTQVTYALGLAGEPAIPFLVALLNSKRAVDQNLSLALCEIFSKVNSDNSSNLLLKIANDPQVARANRLYSIQNIGCVRGARRVIPGLQKLAAADPIHLGPAASAAIMELGGPESVPYFVSALRAKPDTVKLSDIAALQSDGRAAGPALLETLGSADIELRLGAARALGHVGYQPAVDHLLPLLNNEEDWQLTFVVAESLGRLKAQKAIPELKQVASSHWYPRVVKAAQQAIQVIEGKAAYTGPQDDFNRSFFKAESHANGRSMAPRPALQAAYVSTPDTLTRGALDKLKYDIETITWGADGKRVHRSSTSPSSGLRTADGFIVGGDRGEWGGELTYISEQSVSNILLKENIQGIHRLPFGILAVTGIAHMGVNRGALYLVARGESGRYTATLWKRLPGAPRSSGILANGNLFIPTVSGDVVVTPGGKIEMANDDNVISAATNR